MRPRVHIQVPPTASCDLLVGLGGVVLQVDQQARDLRVVVESDAATARADTGRWAGPPGREDELHFANVWVFVESFPVLVHVLPA